VSSDDPIQRAAVARAVATRRVKRRLKAAASIGLAIMAGAFLACTSNKGDKEKARAPVPPNPTTPSVGAVPVHAPAHADSDAGAQSGAALVAPSASATASTAIVPVVKAPPKAPTVDKQEHRKGMPVRDNLLE